MNQQAVKMMARRIQPKQLIVERMRQPCQRMPIRRVGGREGPLDGAPGGVTLDVAVRGDVFLIVQDDERVPNNWAVECDGPRREQDAEDDNQVLAGKQRPAPRTRFRVQFPPACSMCFRESLGAAHVVYSILGSFLF